MKLSFKEDKYALKIARLEKWHRYFALIPIRVAREDYRWLEYIERKGACIGIVNRRWSWKYREISD